MEGRLKVQGQRSESRSMAGIKGTAIESLVADVNRVVQEGRIRPDELEACLQQEDLAILGQKILAALWYPMGTYERLTQLLLRVEGRSEMEYVIERGRSAAARLRDTGIYGQLARNRNELGDRIGRIMVTLGPAMYQDTQWDFHYESSASTTDFRIEVRGQPEENAPLIASFDLTTQGDNYIEHTFDLIYVSQTSPPTCWPAMILESGSGLDYVRFRSLTLGLAQPFLEPSAADVHPHS